MTSAIEADAYLPYPPERVWPALTDPEQLARWLMPNDFVPIVGHRFTFRTVPVPAQGFDGVVRCTVLALVPDSLLRISWTTSAVDTVVSWRLMDEGRGTRLFITQSGFDERDPGQRTVMRSLGRGWRGHLTRRLRESLDVA